MLGNWTKKYEMNLIRLERAAYLLRLALKSGTLRDVSPSAKAGVHGAMILIDYAIRTQIQEKADHTEVTK